jgi:hypothetical protein
MFREKSGWIFERCSLGAWLKAGFSSLGDSITREALAAGRDRLRTALELATATAAQDGEDNEIAAIKLEAIVVSLIYNI